MTKPCFRSAIKYFTKFWLTLFFGICEDFALKELLDTSLKKGFKSLNFKLNGNCL